MAQHNAGLRLWRWIIVHVGIALVPIAAALIVPVFFNNSSESLGPGEVLFFTFMISAIACWDMLEFLIFDGFSHYKMGFMVVLAAGTFGPGLLYAAVLHQTMTSRGPAKAIVFEVSVVLAVLFFLIGTSAELLFWGAERKGFGQLKRPERN